MFEMSDEQFNLIVDHLAKSAQRANQVRGYLVVQWLPGAVLVNATKCTTLAEVVAVTSAVTSAVRVSSRWWGRSAQRSRSSSRGPGARRGARR